MLNAEWASVTKLVVTHAINTYPLPDTTLVCFIFLLFLCFFFIIFIIILFTRPFLNFRLFLYWSSRDIGGLERGSKYTVWQKYYSLKRVKTSNKWISGRWGTLHNEIIHSRYTSQVVQELIDTYPSFCSMKQVGVFVLPPGWDASPSQDYPQH